VISSCRTTRRENSIAKCALSGRLRIMVTGHADGVASSLRGNIRIALCAAVGRCAKQSVGPDRTISSCRRRSERRAGEPRAGKHPRSGEHKLSESRSHFSDHRTLLTGNCMFEQMQRVLEQTIRPILHLQRLGRINPSATPTRRATENAKSVRARRLNETTAVAPGQGRCLSQSPFLTPPKLEVYPWRRQCIYKVILITLVDGSRIRPTGER